APGDPSRNHGARRGTAPHRRQVEQTPADPPPGIRPTPHRTRDRSICQTLAASGLIRRHRAHHPPPVGSPRHVGQRRRTAEADPVMSPKSREPYYQYSYVRPAPVGPQPLEIGLSLLALPVVTVLAGLNEARVFAWVWGSGIMSGLGIGADAEPLAVRSPVEKWNGR